MDPVTLGMAKAYARRRNQHSGPRRTVIGTRSRTGNTRAATVANDSLSNGTDLSETTRIRHFATADAHSIQYVYGNTAMSADGPNDITVKAAHEHSGGTSIASAYFNGQRSRIINPGGLAYTDPIMADVGLGEIFRSRQFVSVASAGMKWPLGPRLVGDLPVYDGKVVGSDVVDSGATPTYNVSGFGPVAVLGFPVTLRPAWFLCGDSITQGVGDSGGEGTTDAGWPSRALNNEYGFINAGRASETAGQYAATAAIRRNGRQQLAQFCTHVLCQHGVNDVKGDVTFAALQTAMQTIWARFARMGLVVYQSTISPVTTGTYADEAGQTVQTSSRETVRVQINDWLRTVPAPLAGIVEAADAFETGRNSGKWKPNFTTDGTHPNNAGAMAAAAAWNPAATYIPF